MLSEFIAQVNKQNINLDAVAVFKNERLLALHRFGGEKIHNVFSVAKSHTATAIGFAIDEGKLSLDDKPTEIFKEIFGDSYDERWSNVTLKNLLTMTTGHGKPHLMVNDRKALRGEIQADVTVEMQKEWLRFAFSRPIVNKVGEKFAYGNLAPYVAGRMLEERVGMTVCDYLYQKMWKRMGVAKPRWDTDNSGHTFGASDLYLDILDMAKLGLLYLNGGTYDGERLLSKEWVKESSAKQVDSTHISKFGFAPDENAGYGYYFWRNAGVDGYRCYGREGQFVIVLPNLNAVIATQAMHSNVQQILDAVWKFIVPKI